MQWNLIDINIFYEKGYIKNSPNISILNQAIQNNCIIFPFSLMMKNRPIHQNLDTSFVNLSALIKYLRRRQFVGSIKIQLNGYEADVHIQTDNQMSVKEHDKISGRISHGEEALQRLLIRAREPGGTIDVYQLVEENLPEKNLETTEKNDQNGTESFPVAEVKVKAVNQNGHSQKETPKKPKVKKTTTNLKIENENVQTKEKSDENPLKKETILPDFPFRLTNKFETKAKQNDISQEDWTMILNLTVEILSVIDKTLAKSKLDFSAAFRKARTEIADDYPFMNPSADKFDYAKGKIKMKEKVNEKFFIASITEAISRILDKLESNPKFKEVHRQTVQTLIALLHKRKPHYDKFSITPSLKKILGL